MRANLKASGYDTVVAMDGNQATELAARELPDLILLDIMMPGKDGFEVCRQLREWSTIPIIMLTARGDDRDKVRCLDMGADDYVSKPFSVNELMARVKAVLRRSQAAVVVPARPTFACDALEVNFTERRVTLGGREVNFTRTEYELLQELALNAGKVLTYPNLLQKIWGPEYGGEREYLHVYIGRLRNKLKYYPGKAEYIVTVPAVGYKMRTA